MLQVRATLTVKIAALVGVLLAPATSRANVTELVPWSNDDGGLGGGGLTASVPFSMSWTRVSGVRRSGIPWGMGPVNYVAGSTVYTWGRSPGTLDVDLVALGAGGTYGSGTGFKAFAQFWNDSQNYIAIGLISDPYACPLCGPNQVTLMIEGHSTVGTVGPIGGYWSNVVITGNAHHFRFQWTATTLSVTMDNPQFSPNPQPLVYNIRMNAPSISFMGGARMPGDAVSALFQNIVFSASGLPANPFSIIVPNGNPYVRFSSPMRVTGTGTGYNAYIHISDFSTGNAMSVGIQADTADVNSRGAPYFIVQRFENRIFDFRLIRVADNNAHLIELAWWDRDILGNTVNIAVFYVDRVPIASFTVDLNPRLMFAVDAGARLNGDTVVADYTTAGGQTGVNVVFSAPQCTPGGSCDLNAFWNVTVPSDPACGVWSCGITATNLNGLPQEGATFRIQGRAAGIPAACPNGSVPGDWDCYMVFGQALIAQQWFGQ
jgi:hypothetical protein